MKNAILIAACFAAGLSGANVQPLLSGLGKIIFPGTAPPATIAASSGGLTYTAGGTNQGHTFVSTGTGGVLLDYNSAAPPAPWLNQNLQIAGKDATAPQLTIDAFGSFPVVTFRRANGTNASKSGILLSNPLMDIDVLGYGSTGYGSSERARIIASAAENWTDTAQGTTMSLAVTAPGGTTLSNVINITSTGVGILGSNSYPLDVVGDVNASGVFRVGGTAGVATTIIHTKNQSGVNCTVTVTGGLVTANGC